MQKLVFCIEPDKDYRSPSTVGNLYMNRFAIDEDAGHEIINIHEASFKTHTKTFKTYTEIPAKTEAEIEQKGTDLIIFIVNSHDWFKCLLCQINIM